MKTAWIGPAAAALLLAACGTEPRERVSGGAAAGAATGAGIGALGGPVGALAGAAIGGGAGAVTGATTSPQDVNLGRPVWENPETRVPGVNNDRGRRGGSAAGRSTAMHASEGTREMQQALASRGYDPGPADGVWGPRSREAAQAFQRANNLAVTGQPTRELRTALDLRPASAGGGSPGMATDTRPPMPPAPPPRDTGASGPITGGAGGGGTGGVMPQPAPQAAPQSNPSQLGPSTDPTRFGPNTRERGDGGGGGGSGGSGAR